MFQTFDSSHRKTRVKFVDIYAFGAQLGEGSYATVKEGINTNNRSLVAIKIISQDKVKLIENGETIIQREVALMRSLKHPNIVHVLDDFAVEEKEKMYIVMEHVSGGSLQNLLERSPDKKLPTIQSQAIFKGLIKGVLYLQDNNIIHRDLKPDNVLLKTDGRVKIADFGTALKIFPEIDEVLIEGSPAYQPPENTNNTDWKKHPLKLDIWSAGICLFLMTIGKYPFENPNPLTLFANIKKGEYVLPDKMNNPLSDLIKGMLQIDPEKRFNAKTVKKHLWLNINDKKGKKDVVNIQEVRTIFDPKTIDYVVYTAAESKKISDPTTCPNSSVQKCTIM